MTRKDFVKKLFSIITVSFLVPFVESKSEVVPPLKDSHEIKEMLIKSNAIARKELLELYSFNLRDEMVIKRLNDLRESINPSRKSIK